MGIRKYRSFRFIENIKFSFLISPRTEATFSILKGVRVTMFESQEIYNRPPPSCCLLHHKQATVVRQTQMIDSLQSSLSQQSLSLHKPRAIGRALYWIPKQWRKMVEWAEITGAKDYHSILCPSRLPSLPMLPYFTFYLWQRRAREDLEISSFIGGLGRFGIWSLLEDNALVDWPDS